MTSVSAGHIKLTPTQPVGSGRPQKHHRRRESEHIIICDGQCNESFSSLTVWSNHLGLTVESHLKRHVSNVHCMEITILLGQSGHHHVGVTDCLHLDNGGNKIKYILMTYT